MLRRLPPGKQSEGLRAPTPLPPAPPVGVPQIQRIPAKVDRASLAAQNLFPPNFLRQRHGAPRTGRKPFARSASGTRVSRCHNVRPSLGRAAASTPSNAEESPSSNAVSDRRSASGASSKNGMPGPFFLRVTQEAPAGMKASWSPNWKAPAIPARRSAAHRRKRSH